VLAHLSVKILAQEVAALWRMKMPEPPTENSLPLELAALCACENIYDERLGRCPRCADTADHALKLITVLNRDGGDATQKEDN